jgi:hypothetical protein
MTISLRYFTLSILILSSVSDVHSASMDTAQAGHTRSKTTINNITDLNQATFPISHSDSIRYLIELISIPFDSCQAKRHLKQTLYKWASAHEFFVDASLGTAMPLEKRNVAKDLANAFPIKCSQLDSMALVVNYVYVNYTYDQSTEPLETDNVDSIATLLAQGNLTGVCGDQSSYLEKIIQKLFPWWGYCIQLNSSSAMDSDISICIISHAFVGLANKDGEVMVVLDPTINGIWVDTLSGNALTLKECRVLLKNPYTAWRVIKYKSTFFGKYHSQWSDSPYELLSIQFSSFDGIVAHAVQGRTSSYIITGPWIDMDDIRSPMRLARDFYWKALNFPTMTWANNMLIIKYGWCSNPDIQEKFIKNTFEECKINYPENVIVKVVPTPIEDLTAIGK